MQRFLPIALRRNSRYGVSSQIVPTTLSELLADADAEKSQRVMQAMLKMKKIEIDVLERAAAQA